MKIAMIVAMDENGCIGNQGNLPWRLKSDMLRFKSLTEGDGYNAVIMGRKTWDSLPESFRPLPERVNVVMSRDTKWSADGADAALYPGRAIEIAYAEACDECWIIGGAQIYAMYLDKVEEIHITTVHTTSSGDVSFPEWNRSGWSEEIVESTEADDENEFSTTYSIWKK
ncbi:MAG: dihydrofolate reductase [Candidatus Thalassarchaeaceae archaeon]|jgi:dihydrofolate reductase|nr:dihydrofolate reductase [Candidatus Thalassarchaeaceae archaeon]